MQRHFGEFLLRNNHGSGVILIPRTLGYNFGTSIRAIANETAKWHTKDESLEVGSEKRQNYDNPPACREF